MPWSPPARHGTPTSPPTAPDPRPLPSSPPDVTSWRIEANGRGEPCAAFRTNAYLDAHHGQPRPSSHQPDYTLLGSPPYGYAGTDDGRITHLSWRRGTPRARRNRTRTATTDAAREAQISPAPTMKAGSTGN